MMVLHNGFYRSMFVEIMSVDLSWGLPPTKKAATSSAAEADMGLHVLHSISCIPGALGTVPARQPGQPGKVTTAANRSWGATEEGREVGGWGTRSAAHARNVGSGLLQSAWHRTVHEAVPDQLISAKHILLEDLQLKLRPALHAVRHGIVNVNGVGPDSLVAV